MMRNKQVKSDAPSSFTRFDQAFGYAGKSAVRITII